MIDKSDLTDSELNSLLRAVADDERPPRPVRTDQCVQPLMLTPWESRKNWSDADQAHVESCNWCQRQLAIGWRVQCPGVIPVLRYFLDPEGAPNHRALRIHLDEDQCETCWSRLESAWFRNMAQVVKAGRRLTSGVCLELPTPIGHAAGVGEARAIVSEVDPESGLRWRREIEGGYFVVFVDSASANNVDSTVRVELLGETGVLASQQVQLRMRPDGNVVGRADFGRVDQLELEIDDIKAISALPVE